MPRAYLKWGDWNAICDVCGFRCKASEMKKRWDGLMVCPQDYELRQPQDFLRVRGDQPAVPWTRPEPQDIFVGPACFVWSQSGYANLGEAGCMQAGNGVNTSINLWFMKWPFNVPSSMTETQFSGIPGYAIPGWGQPGVTFTGLSF